MSIVSNSRLEANRKIIGLLANLVETYPDWRFHQILTNVNVNVSELDNNGLLMCKDMFYEESEDTLDRVASNDIVKRLNNPGKKTWVVM